MLHQKSRKRSRPAAPCRCARALPHRPMPQAGGTALLQKECSNTGTAVGHRFCSSPPPSRPCAPPSAPAFCSCAAQLSPATPAPTITTSGLTAAALATVRRPCLRPQARRAAGRLRVKGEPTQALPATVGGRSATASIELSRRIAPLAAEDVRACLPMCTQVKVVRL